MIIPVPEIINITRPILPTVLSCFHNETARKIQLNAKERKASCMSHPKRPTSYLLMKFQDGSISGFIKCSIAKIAIKAMLVQKDQSASLVLFCNVFIIILFFRFQLIHQGVHVNPTLPFPYLIVSFHPCPFQIEIRNER